MLVKDQYWKTRTANNVHHLPADLLSAVPATSARVVPTSYATVSDQQYIGVHVVTLIPRLPCNERNYDSWEVVRPVDAKYYTPIGVA